LKSATANKQISGNAKAQKLNYIEDQSLTINRNFVFDSKQSLILNRQDTINVRLSDSALSIGDDAKDSNPFDGKVVLNLVKGSNIPFNIKGFLAALNKDDVISFNRDDLAKRKADISVNSDKVFADVIDMGKPDLGTATKANAVNEKWTTKLYSDASVALSDDKQLSHLQQSHLQVSTVIFSK